MDWRAVLVLLSIVGGVFTQNCRGEELKPRACENVCDENGQCKIRAALLLPKNTTFYASLPVVEPVLDLAIQSQAIRNAFPPWLSFEWTTYDVTDCDAAYAVISAIDAYNDCAHVFFGPACDFALASVARITKFLGNSGIPLITTGGFTFDFVQQKQTCQDEFYMLVRTSPLGFKDMAYFIINVMRQFEWNRAALLYESSAFAEYVGARGGHLLASTIHDYLIREGFHIIGRELQGNIPAIETLRHWVGFDYSSKSVFCPRGYWD
ncbi:unnamed protein product [Pieris brassicae]|uniref:Receptor ligand binding region domain-containing protein n=1 Tax=Pieris brassicae TaxID=7116 RepID=A0A9P0T940_PIEBR|nr:unnamed protein product [Pieris brassicae]